MDRVKKNPSRNSNMIRACSIVILGALIMVLFMRIFDESQKKKSIDLWKTSLKSNPDKRYLDLMRTSLVLSLQDSSYCNISDEDIVSILLSAEIVSTKGYIPKVEDQQNIKSIRKNNKKTPEEYYAVIIGNQYVFVADKDYAPVWGTRPLEPKIVPGPNTKTLRMPQKITLWHFLFSFYETLWFKLS